MRDESGMDLDWFWRDWIYTTARLDQAVDSVGTAEGDQKVFLSNRGTMTLPLEMDLTYDDGTTRARHAAGRDVESRARASRTGCGAGNGSRRSS